jgi:rubrerythrin
MKDKIKELIETIPKVYIKFIKNRPELLAWVMSNTKLPLDRSLPEHTRSALYEESDICHNGSKMKWVGANTGWGSCGRPTQCQCARESVSSAVKASKAQRSQADIDAENLKREQTNLAKYGVTNTGQTTKARANHEAFYSDSVRVTESVEKLEQTMLTKYGVKNAQQVDEFRQRSKKTILERYGVENPMKNSEVANKSAKNRETSFDKILNLESNHDGFVTNALQRWHVHPLITKEEYAAVGGVASRPLLVFRCADCGNEFEKRFDYGAPPVCKVCHPTETSFCSTEEREVFDYVRSIYNGKMISGDRQAINPFQLDIYLPELKLAIEYCGLYWHSENGGNSRRMSWNYHQMKMKLCAERGIRLITMFSDEWVMNRSIVEKKLVSIIGTTSSKVGARKCNVITVEYQTAKAFYDLNHIQGGEIRNSVNLALVHDDAIVAMMGFKKNGNRHELTRYASSVNVVGGASKLLHNFINNYSPSEIYSFADLRWSNGDLYHKIGFTLGSEVPPMQSYVEKYSQRHHKLKFKKSRQQDRLPSETEWQYLQRLGFDRIWDCGKLKFIMKT